MRRLITSLAVVVFMVIAFGCGSSQPLPVDNSAAVQQQPAPAPTPPVPVEPPPVVNEPIPTTTPAPTPVPFPDHQPRDTYDDERPRLLEPMNLDAVTALVERFKNDDPYRDYFTVEGKVRDSWKGGNVNEGPEKNNLRLVNLHTFAEQNQYLEKLFLALPVLARREVMAKAAPAVMAYVVEYAHPNHVKAWITDLDWAKQIETINPDLYAQTDWPEDREKSVEIQGYGNVSKTDYWVRMFWKRRGEAVFNAVKTAALKSQKKSAS